MQHTAIGCELHRSRAPVIREGCPGLPGLESRDTAARAGSHWRRRERHAWSPSSFRRPGAGDGHRRHRAVRGLRLGVHGHRARRLSAARGGTGTRKRRVVAGVGALLRSRRPDGGPGATAESDRLDPAGQRSDREPVRGSRALRNPRPGRPERLVALWSAGRLGGRVPLVPGARAAVHGPSPGVPGRETRRSTLALGAEVHAGRPDVGHRDPGQQHGQRQ